VFPRPVASIRERDAARQIPPVVRAIIRLAMYELSLPFRSPFDWTCLVGWFAPRAIPRIETVDGGRYSRVVTLGRHVGTIDVALDRSREALRARVSLPVSTRGEVTRRLRAMFDLDADPRAIRDVLGRAPLVGPIVRRHPGIRIPGAWDPFEIVVRAIVGQQVSVAGARTILGRIVARATGGGGRVAFPEPARLAETDLLGLGMPDKRAGTLRAVALAVAAGEIDLHDAPAAKRGLLATSGIGPWTVEYVALRALCDRDAFPDGDLVLRRVAGDGAVLSSRALHEMAEAWRPLRAYAALLLWTSGARRAAGGDA
jgi:AraC family transcriptional regulator, regulatory protein of adaptative response / DNA-3-methyladenine glycosylase II